MTDHEQRYRELGQFVEERIKERGMKKGDVAGAAGFDPATLREIMRGVVRDRSPATWANLNAALGLPEGALRSVVDGQRTIEQLRNFATFVEPEPVPDPGTDARDDQLLLYAFRMLPPARRRHHLDAVLTDAMEIVVTEVDRMAPVARFEELLAVADPDALNAAIDRVAARDENDEWEPIIADDFPERRAVFFDSVAQLVEWRRSEDYNPDAPVGVTHQRGPISITYEFADADAAIEARGVTPGRDVDQDADRAAVELAGRKGMATAALSGDEPTEKDETWTAWIRDAPTTHPGDAAPEPE